MNFRSQEFLGLFTQNSLSINPPVGLVETLVKLDAKGTKYAWLLNSYEINKASKVEKLFGAKDDVLFYGLTNLDFKYGNPRQDIYSASYFERLIKRLNFQIEVDSHFTTEYSLALYKAYSFHHDNLMDFGDKEDIAHYYHCYRNHYKKHYLPK